MFHVKPFILSILFFACAITGKSQGFVTLMSAVEYDYPVKWDDEVVNFNKSQPGYSKLNNREKEYYYWINYSRINPKRFWDSICAPIIKQQPALKGKYATSLKANLIAIATLPLFRLNDTLIKTAGNHALDIAKAKRGISHNSTNGQTFPERMKAAGIKTCAGENIGMGPDDMIMALFLLYLDQGLPSLGHRKALLNTSYLSIGVGVEQQDKSYIINVQDFSCR